MRAGTAESFLLNLEALNPFYQKLKQSQKQDHVLRYIGDLYGDIVIQGARAEAEITTRGVFGDLLRIAEKKIKPKHL